MTKNHWSSLRSYSINGQQVRLTFFSLATGRASALDITVSISDSLAAAKLMFVFLSPHSLNSRWVHFEAGNAYAKNVQVVPVCLPGLIFDNVSQPLSLLQGFNLHSAESLGNLARLCNETLELKLPERFSEEEFRQIGFSASAKEGFFGRYTRLIKSVGCHANTIFTGKLSNAVETFIKIRDEEKADWCQFARRSNDTGETFATHGAQLKFYISDAYELDKPTNLWKAGLYITANFGMDLFPINAPFIEKFGNALGIKQWEIDIQFYDNVKTPDWMELTTKLFGTGIRLTGDHTFEVEGQGFSLNQYAGVGIKAQRRKLQDPWLVGLIDRLFSAEFLVEGSADAPTDVERLAAALQKRGDDMFTT